jgi:hypothetical protein
MDLDADCGLESSYSAADFDKWSWGNQIAPWQWYIHGSAATSKYLAVSSSYKNPADTTDAQGVKTTIVSTPLQRLAYVYA